MNLNFLPQKLMNHLSAEFKFILHNSQVLLQAQYFQEFEIPNRLICYQWGLMILYLLELLRFSSWFNLQAFILKQKLSILYSLGS